MIHAKFKASVLLLATLKDCGGVAAAISSVAAAISSVAAAISTVAAAIRCVDQV